MDKQVMVFAPSPELTVTVEDRDGEADIHLHAGGQGVWQSRMIASLGVPVVLCAAFGGETGRVLRSLLTAGGIELIDQDVTARNGGYVHDRRGDSGRQPVAGMPGDALSRHELDELYETTLLRGLASETAVLSGTWHPRPVPADVYRRLAGDLTANGCRVIADLSGERLDAALEGGLHLVKVSHEEMLEDRRADGEEPAELIEGMWRLREHGAAAVVVSRASAPALALFDDTVWEVHGPELHTVDTRGAGDSMTGAMAAALTQGAELPDAIRLGAAAGALNVTRHGLGSSSGEGAAELVDRVELRRHQPKRKGHP
ncbi:1-phosphofructokinase family hexose kinase [Amycolatopsis nigrescens]|uniref:1-phosphofructokinase family hexose kinase n=1 Tax=Amycolatopsis nigrescens TaxID=381445 RepID=UPI000381C9C0|nr:PfkB family carbohydrate kinase [Amycolatopsis nigrescens]